MIQFTALVWALLWQCADQYVCWHVFISYSAVMIQFTALVWALLWQCADRYVCWHVFISYSAVMIQFTALVWALLWECADRCVCWHVFCPEMQPHVSEISIYNFSSCLREMIISKNISRKNLFGFFFMNRPPEALYPTIKIRHRDAVLLMKGPLHNCYSMTASLKNVLQTRCRGMLLAWSPWKGYP